MEKQLKQSKTDQFFIAGEIFHDQQSQKRFKNDVQLISLLQWNQQNPQS